MQKKHHMQFEVHKLSKLTWISLEKLSFSLLLVDPFGLEADDEFDELDGM